MKAAARAALIASVADEIKKADDAMVRASRATSEDARRILTEASDALDLLPYKEDFMAAAFQDDELARLHGELERRKDAIHAQWSALSPRHN
jgi:hypothetical protein